MGERIREGELTPRELSRQEFGRRLHKLLIEKGWTQSDLARQAGVGRDAISKYVNAVAFPTPLQAEKIAKALGVSREELLPNLLMNALDKENPAIELRQAAGHPNKAWLRINRSVSFATGAKIIALINEEDEREAGQ